MQKKILLATSVFSSVFFVLTSWIWTYWLNLFLSLPVGLLALILLLVYRSKYGMDRGVVIVARLLTLGLITAFISLGFILLYN
jgi:hypothetical protein